MGASIRRPAALRLAYLRKESLAGSWRAVHEDVPVQAIVLPRVPCRDGNVTHTLLKGRLSDLKIDVFFLLKKSHACLLKFFLFFFNLFKNS